MKLILAPFALIFILFQFPPFGGSPEEKPEEKPPVKGWWVVSHFAIPPTRYSSSGEESSRPKAVEAVPLYTGSRRKRKGFPRPFLEMEDIERGTIRHRDPEKIDLMRRPGSWSFSGRRVFSDSLRGQDPPGRRSNTSGQAVFPRKRFSIIRERRTPRSLSWNPEMEKQDNGWTSHGIFERITRELFGAEPASLLAIGIQTDTDQSNEMVTAYYSEPILRKK